MSDERTDHAYRDACIRADLHDVRVELALHEVACRRGEQLDQTEAAVYARLAAMPRADVDRALILLLTDHDLEILRMADSLEEHGAEADEVTPHVMAATWWRRWHGKHEAGAR